MEIIEKKLEEFRLASWKHGREAYVGGELLRDNSRRVSTLYNEIIRLIKNRLKSSEIKNLSDHSHDPDDRGQD